MTRLLLAGGLVVAALSGAGPAAACELETCFFTSPVCSQVNCHICYYEPPGAQRCIT